MSISQHTPALPAALQHQPGQRSLIMDRKIIDFSEEFDRWCSSAAAAQTSFDNARTAALAIWPVVPKRSRIRADSYWATDCPVTGGALYENGVQQNYMNIPVAGCHRAMSRTTTRGRSSKKAEEWAMRLADAEAYEAKCRAVRERFDVDGLYHALRQARISIAEVVAAIAAAEAETMAGLAAKARVFLSKEARPFFSVSGDLLLVSLARDVAWLTSSGMRIPVPEPEIAVVAGSLGGGGAS